jgi:epoxyqueuosine reductase
MALPWPRLDLLALLAQGEEELMARFDHCYIPRRRAGFLRRNILVALGNGGDESAVRPVAAYLEHPEPMLRAHSAWALGEISGSGAREALQNAARRETDQEVRMEIESALAG